MWSIAALTGDQQAAKKAWTVLPSLMESGKATGIWGRSNHPSRMSAEVPSSIIQGVVISLLIRFASVIRDHELDRLIGRAIQRLLAPVHSGTMDHVDDRPFLEEFPSRSHVFNGCMFGLFGLYDAVARGYEESRVAAAIEQTLITTLPRFTTCQGWSRYSLDTHGMSLLASYAYHVGHIDLGTVLAQRTQAQPVWDTLARWAKALASPPIRSAIALRKTLQTIWARDVRRLPLRVGSVVLLGQAFG
jgi:hypothetical protein